MFGLPSLIYLERTLQSLPSPHRLLIQYVPHSFGWKAMNLLFCVWVALSQRQNHVWVMFHEVNSPHPIIKPVNALMARCLLSSAEQVFVPTASWEQRLKDLAGLKKPIIDLPVPSSLPDRVDESKVAEARSRFTLQSGATVFGHFGIHAPAMQNILGQALLELLSRNSRSSVVLIGAGSVEFGNFLTNLRPEFSTRIISLGILEAEEAAVCLSACDVLLCPFLDGVSGRRTSLMAGLALGLPIVTTVGAATESFWRESKAVALAESLATADLVAAAEMLALDDRRRKALGSRACTFYKEKFSIERTIAILRQ
jgi:hypothetical protein